MDMILEILINLFGEGFLNDKLERIKNKRMERKKRFRIKRLIRHYEWFEQLYRVNTYRFVIEHDDVLLKKLLDKKYVRELDLNLNERVAFERLLADKARIHVHEVQESFGIPMAK